MFDLAVQIYGRKTEMTASKASEPTPRTDAACVLPISGEDDMSHRLRQCGALALLARTLERDLSAATARAAHMQESHVSLMAEADRRHDELMEEIKVQTARAAEAEAKVRELQEAKRPWTPEFTKSVVDGQVSEIDRLTALVQAEREKAAEAEERCEGWMKANSENLADRQVQFLRAQAAELDAGRWDYLDKLGGGKIDRLPNSDPPRVIKLWRNGLGRWVLERCNGEEFEDFEMEELADSWSDVRSAIDAALRRSAP